MSPQRRDQVLRWVTQGTGSLAALIAMVILAFLLVESWPALHALGPLRFLQDNSWHPSGGPASGAFQLTAMLATSLVATAGALFLATPLGIAAALCCQYYCGPSIAGGLRHALLVMAGVPSVVYGFWGLTVLAPLIRQWHPPGQSLLAAILVLAIMVVPTITILSERALAALPLDYTRAAAALGLSRWTTIRRILLPAAAKGIKGAVVLAAGRAIGETMAVLMVAGNVIRAPGGLFLPVRTLTANIALELGYALDFHRSALFVSGLVLALAVTGLTGLAAWTRRKGAYE